MYSTKLPKLSLIAVMGLLLSGILACDFGGGAGPATPLVTPGTPGLGKPTVTLESPAGNVQLAAGQRVRVACVVEDPKGVVSVELAVDGVLYATEHSPTAGGDQQWRLVETWTANVAPGTHTLTVTAYNLDNVASDPAIIYVTVVQGAAPGETATLPPSGPTATPAPTNTPVPTPAAETCTLKVGMVSDIGGIDDASFNQNTWEGLEKARDELGVCAQFIESQAQADYEKNITEFAEQGYDLIITVGFLLGDATSKMAAQYPDTKFAIVDFAYDPGIRNVVGIVFNTDEAAFLTGYLGSYWAHTQDPEDPQLGYVAGMQIPAVEILVAGHEAAVAYYNEQHDANVQIKGAYVGDFEAPDEGKIRGLSLIDGGADVIYGIGGKTGNGGLTAAKERGVWGVGVEVDQYNTLPNEKDILITSTIKRMDNAVFGVVKSVLDGTFVGGGVYVGTLENGGVDMAPFHDFEDQIPAEIVSELDAIRAGIIDGSIDTGWEG